MTPLFLRYLIVLVLAALAGWLASHAFGVFPGLAAAISVMALPLGYSYLNVARLKRLFSEGGDEPAPAALGAWGQIFSSGDRLISGMRKHLRELESQHNRFIEGFQASPNGVIMLDAMLRIDWCNASAENFFGLNLNRDRQQIISYLIRQPDFVQYLSLKKFEQPVVIQQMGPLNDLTVVVQIFPFADHQFLLLAQDITDSQKTEAMRRDFVANVSHEIRTPLTVLIGFLETMQTIELKPEQQSRYLNLMMNQSVRMKNLVEDLLTLANLEANSSFAPLTEFDVASEMAALKSDAEALSSGRHRLVFEIDAELSVYGEQRELQSAFSNLISNAIRYTPEGGQITVSWGLSPSRHGVFSVTDTGPGIEAIHLPRLTERFYRVDGSRSRDTGGTGLGLAIVKHIANRHNAQLLITSVVGEGSTFKIRFAPERLLARASRLADI
jgi:two-component system, OmpR family, phosphate regulon sensor histidine kinase PhoR